MGRVEECGTTMVDSFTRDSLDVDRVGGVEGCFEEGSEGFARAAAHALAFAAAWGMRFGAPPSGSMHSSYCGGEVPRGPLDLPRFEAFAAAAVPSVAGRQATRESAAALADYERRLMDAGYLREEILRKIASRYSTEYRLKGLRGGESLREAHGVLSDTPPTPWSSLARNPASGNNVGCGMPCPPPPPAEAWRMVMERDILLASRASMGSCVFVDSSEGWRGAAVAAIAGELRALYGGPVTIASDCPRALERASAALREYHYTVHLPCAEAHGAAPRLFRAFVLFGGSSAGRRPLCMDRGRCWHYALTPDGYSGSGGEYSVVASCPEGLAASQRASGGISYIVPMLHDPTRPPERRPVGVHPDSVHLLKGVINAPEVPPSQASACTVYVSCVSEEGVSECMSAGGVAVARSFRLIDDGVSGFLSGRGDADSVTFAVTRAVGADAEDIGREAARVLIIHGAETFSWLWRGILGRPDPVVTKSPSHAATLYERFLALSCVMRFREISRLRCAVAGGDRRAVVFSDTRPSPGTAMSVLLTMSNLRPGWTVVGMVSPASRGYFERALGHLTPDLFEPPALAKTGFFIEQYNSMMKSVDTWIEMSRRAETVLMVQEDGCIVRRGLEAHACYEYDYCGAPWADNPLLRACTGGNLVGNGGLSLRSVPAMLDACRRGADESSSVYAPAPFMSEPEDVFFSRLARACPYGVARSFSMEQIQTDSALGFHQFWAYHPVDYTVSHLERILRDTASTVPSTAPSRARIL